VNTALQTDLSDASDIGQDIGQIGRGPTYYVGSDIPAELSDPSTSEADDRTSDCLGTEHWNPYVPGRHPRRLYPPSDHWGEEFIPGYHVDISQPSRLRPLLKPWNPDVAGDHEPQPTPTEPV
jgi:hypothetical protein